MGGSEESAPAASPAQLAYFEALERGALKVLEVARAARGKGYDPSMDVEIPLAADLAARVEEQVHIQGVAQRIRELTRQLRVRELVALHCAREVAEGRFQPWRTRELALEKAVRTGLSILTEGILVAPLEGIAKATIGKNADGTDYADLYFAGPIRSAGGTAQAMSVLIADVVRRDLGIGRFHCNQAEVERYKEEVPAYKRAQHLQYAPGPEEIELIVRNCPVCVNGEGTEQEEVTGHRNLPRVETNRLRGGAVLVLAEGLSQKAAKMAKIVAQLQLPDWGFLETLARRSADRTAGVGGSNGADLEPSDKFIQELIAGRPVLAHPSRIGGFRLRYGRSRTGGLASTSISPVTMHAVDEFLAVGTQMKIERPGKATIVTPCGALEGPILLLANGDLVQPATVAAYREVANQVVQITDLGEILIPYGEFLENNAALAEASFTEHWWRAEVEAAGGPAALEEVSAAPTPSFGQALEWSARWNVPLHPAHNLFWHDVEWSDYRALSEAIAGATIQADALLIPKSGPAKSALIALGALHRETTDAYRVEGRWEALASGCGHRAEAGRLISRPDRATLTEQPPALKWPALAAAARFTGVAIKPRAPARIGARMGRPEKADKRTMDPPVHVLFPVGHEGGVQRSVEEATAHRVVVSRVGLRGCAACGRKTYLVRCVCGARTEPTGAPPQDLDIEVRQDFRRALARLVGIRAPKKVKGVQGLISAAKTPEALEKGILRATHEVWVFKDGTIRFDATDAPLTHFRPVEIRTPVAQLRQLGYDRDVRGEPLERDDQVVELRVQDVVLPEVAGPYFVQVAAFVDDLLQRFYGLAPFYQVQSPADLVGHLVAGLAPHTSGAVLGRIIGFTKAHVGYAHPFFHTAKRRNSDGDEDAYLLLLDAFLNFSRSFIPEHRGGLMDLPLVLATRIDPSEIDKEAQNLDVGWRYPLELYRAAEKRLPARDVAPRMDLVLHRLGTARQYEGFGYTDETRLIHEGPLDSRYKTLETMPEKMAAQLALADRLRGVDGADVAARVIAHHLLPDLIGNLKAFAKQSVRCTKCNVKYRRMPLSGRCTRRLGKGSATCDNLLTLTVHQASVRKYLDLCLELSQKYEIPEYTRQHIRLVQKFIDDSFRTRETKLASFG